MKSLIAQRGVLLFCCPEIPATMRGASTSPCPARSIPSHMNTLVAFSQQTISSKSIPSIQAGSSIHGVILSSRPMCAGHIWTVSVSTTNSFSLSDISLGIDTIRGYEDYGIFPGNNNPNGGDKVLYANFEYRIPLANQLTGVVFFDIGQVWDESVSNIFDDISLKKGAGIGVRFDLMGMLARLEWGYGFDREIDGRTVPKGKFHFTIGPGF